MQRHLIFLVVASLGAGAFAAHAETPDTKETIKNIRRLGRGDVASLPDLSRYLDNGDPDIREEAVKAIVKIDTMRSVDPLLKAIRDNDSEIQIRSIDGLVNAYVPGFVQNNSVSGLFTKGVRQVKSFFSFPQRHCG